MRRHDLDLLSLFVGLVFLLVATTHLLAAAADSDTSLGWLFPVVLVGLGAAGIAGALRPVRREAVAAGTARGSEIGIRRLVFFSGTTARRVARVANGSGL